ncbi:MAG: hypothetical protein GTN36_04750 [Candidatus Aenigmarchaeota archaeon]|nr:hypothetical protein [Candidatus Aenigmarchaeota archaeon]
MKLNEKIRTYLDDVPESVKEELSRAWGERKRETYSAAEKHGIKIEEGDSFNRVVTFELEPGFYHIKSDIVSVRDISPEYSDIGILCEGVISRMVTTEKEKGCNPLFASNVCDWDSRYAKKVGANVRLRDSIIKSCIKNDIVLIGGETANLGDQVREKGMSWMFTLLSEYTNSLTNPTRQLDSEMDLALQSTFDHIADSKNYEIVYEKGMPLLHVKKKAKLLMTADGTGSKSKVCEKVNKRTDINDTLAMCCDDATREGGFPIIGSIGTHAENSRGKNQITSNMIETGKNNSIPLIGCAYHVSADVDTYIMNGVVLSEVREGTAHIGKKIEIGLPVVLLYEEQRSNGITMQRRILSETFGEEWYEVKSSEALKFLNKELQGKYSDLKLHDEERSLGELVAQPSTPYFRVDSMMPQHLLDKVKFRINVSSGGLIGKTRRLLEPVGLGANYHDVFGAPGLILLLQMSSRLEGTRGVVTDKVAYYTWGCGNGAAIGTEEPESIVDYYNSKGIRAKIGGVVIAQPEINITSKCLDSTLKSKPHIINHKYREKPLG